jgi:hypothetical protein
VRDALKICSRKDNVELLHFLLETFLNARMFSSIFAFIFYGEWENLRRENLDRKDKKEKMMLTPCLLEDCVMMAIQHDCLNVVKYFVESTENTFYAPFPYSKPDYLKARSCYGRTSGFTLAVHYGAQKIIDYFLNHWWSLNSQSIGDLEPTPLIEMRKDRSAKPVVVYSVVTRRSKCLYDSSPVQKTPKEEGRRYAPRFVTRPSIFGIVAHSRMSGVDSVVVMKKLIEFMKREAEILLERSQNEEDYNFKLTTTELYKSHVEQQHERRRFVSIFDSQKLGFHESVQLFLAMKKRSFHPNNTVLKPQKNFRRSRLHLIAMHNARSLAARLGKEELVEFLEEF